MFAMVFVLLGCLVGCWLCLLLLWLFACGFCLCGFDGCCVLLIIVLLIMYYFCSFVLLCCGVLWLLGCCVGLCLVLVYARLMFVFFMMWFCWFGCWLIWRDCCVFMFLFAIDLLHRCFICILVWFYVVAGCVDLCSCFDLSCVVEWRMFG